MKKHYDQIDAIKGIAIFLVILGHSIIYFPVNLHLVPWCQWLFEMVGFHMPLFFAVSGFCYSYRKENGYIKGYLSKKIHRLLIPYLIFGLLDMIPRILLTQFVNRPDAGWQDSLYHMLFYGGQYWFLYVLFLIFSVFPLVEYGFEKYGKGFLLCCMAVLAASHEYMPTLLLLNSVTYHLIYFTIGFFLRREFESGRLDKWKKWITYPWLMVISALWLAGLILRCEMGYGWLTIPSALCGSAMVAGIVLLAKPNGITKYMKKLGQYSLQLYLLNGFTLGISRLLILKITTMPLAIIAGNMLIDCHCAYLFIDKVMAKIKILRRMSGIL